MRALPRNVQPASSPADQARQCEDVDREVARIATMNVDALRSEWRGFFGSDPPSAFSKDFLAREISYRIQEDAYGALSPSAARLLRSLLRPGAEPPRQVKVGSVIVREHKGVVHEVLVTPGGFCWQGKTYESLSTIAKKITGVTWNGPRFFGLRSKKDGDQALIDDGRASEGKATTAAIGPRRAGRRSSLRSAPPSVGVRP